MTIFAAEGEWSIWNNGTCSVPCGNGTMRQTRNCSNPEVAGKEVTCTGEPFRDVDCNVGPCPGRVGPAQVRQLFYI